MNGLEFEDPLDGWDDFTGVMPSLTDFLDFDTDVMGKITLLFRNS